MTTSPHCKRYNTVVLPALSSPRIRMRTSFSPQSFLKRLEKKLPAGKRTWHRCEQREHAHKRTSKNQTGGTKSNTATPNASIALASEHHDAAPLAKRARARARTTTTRTNPSRKLRAPCSCDRATCGASASPESESESRRLGWQARRPSAKTERGVQRLGATRRSAPRRDALLHAAVGD